MGTEFKWYLNTGPEFECSDNRERDDIQNPDNKYSGYYLSAAWTQSHVRRMMPKTSHLKLKALAQE